MLFSSCPWTTRPGHGAVAEAAAMGYYYAQVKARKYYDGKLDTFMSEGEFAILESKQREAQAEELRLAVTRMSWTSPSGLEEALYFEAAGSKVGKEEKGKLHEAFEIDIMEQLEEELMDSLRSPDLSEQMAKSIIDGTIDSMALPGG